VNKLCDLTSQPRIPGLSLCRKGARSLNYVLYQPPSSPFLKLQAGSVASHLEASRKTLTSSRIVSLIIFSFTSIYMYIYIISWSQDQRSFDMPFSLSSKESEWAAGLIRSRQTRQHNGRFYFFDIHIHTTPKLPYHGRRKKKRGLVEGNPLKTHFLSYCVNLQFSSQIFIHFLKYHPTAAGAVRCVC